MSLSGKKFGRLTILGEPFSVRYSTSAKHVVCRCTCREVVVIRLRSVTAGVTRSCGCLQRTSAAMTGFANSTHKQTGGRLYNIWSHMRRRCNDSHHHAYDNYGGRGIAVCDEWDESFEHFMKWALGNGYSDNLSIDRIDNDGDYEPSNCRWATQRQQQNNKRTNRIISAFGEEKTLSQWSRDHRCSVTALLIQVRIDRFGWSTEDAIQKPKYGTQYEAFGEAKHLAAWAADSRCLVSRDVLRNRVLKHKWTLERALQTKKRSW